MLFTNFYYKHTSTCSTLKVTAALQENTKFYGDWESPGHIFFTILDMD